MNETERKQIQKVIKQVAAQKGTSVEAVRKEMQLAIEVAYRGRHEPGHEGFILTFGDRCPSVEEFILKTAILSVVERHNIPFRGETNEGKA